MKTDRVIYSVFLLSVAVWCVSILLAPALRSIGGWGHDISDVLYGGFSTVCHQMESRSLHIAGQQFGVCARCSAIYFAFFAGLLLYPAVRRLGDGRVPSRTWLAVALLPMVIDVALHYSGIHASALWTRLLTGTLAGFALPFFILPTLIDAVRTMLQRSHPSVPQLSERNLS